MKPYEEKDQGTLLSKTLALLDKDTTPAHVLFSETGLPYYWLKDMKAGKSKDPSVNRIQYLYEYLTRNQLKV